MAALAADRGSVISAVLFGALQRKRFVASCGIHASGCTPSALSIHLRAVRPISRRDDDFLASILHKIDQIREISENFDIVILGGDIFDRPDASHGRLMGIPSNIRFEWQRWLEERLAPLGFHHPADQGKGSHRGAGQEQGREASGELDAGKPSKR